MMLAKVKEFVYRYSSPQFVRFVFTAILNTAFGLFVNYLFLFIFEHLFKLNHAYVVSNLLAFMGVSTSPRPVAYAGVFRMKKGTSLPS